VGNLLRLLPTTIRSLRKREDRGLLWLVVGHDSERALLEREDAIGHDCGVEVADAEQHAEPELAREGVQEVAGLECSAVAEGVE